MVSLLIGAARACANVAVRALHRHRRHSARVLKHFLDPLSLQLLCMSYHLRSGAVPCLGSKQSLANALHSRTCHRSSPHLRASRTAVVVLALQKTRVVRGKCYVTKDVSTLFVQPLFCALRLLHSTCKPMCLAEHRHRSDYSRRVPNAGPIQGIAAFIFKALQSFKHLLAA